MFNFNIPNFFSREIITHRISFYYISLSFLIFTFIYSFPKISASNTLPTKYFKNINENDIENNADIYLLSTRDGYLHALNKDKEEIWKAYLDQELMSSFTARIINKNLYLYPLNEQIYVIENNKLIRLDIFIKDLVKKQYISLNDFTLMGKIKTTIYKIDLETGEIVKKIDEDSNIINTSKKITIRQKNRMRKTLTVVRVDYILNCLELIEGEKFWNATYSDILIKKDNDNSDNNFIIGNNFLKKLINGYKNNNIQNHEINYDNIITAYAYFNDENFPNIKIYDRSNKNEEYDEARKYIDDYNKYKYTLGFDSDNNSNNYNPIGNEEEKNERYENKDNINTNENIIMKYIMINKFLVMIIILLCSILFYIYHKYIKNSNINNNKINNEQKNEQNISEKKEIINNEIDKKNNEKDEKINEEDDIHNSKELNNDKNEKENTNITEESKDYMNEEEKKEDEKEIENIISQINITNKKNETSIQSRDSLSKKINEKNIIKNNIWDSDDDEDEENNNEKSETINKKKSKSKSIKITTKSKSNKKNSQSNIQNNIWDDDEEEDEKEEEITTKNKNKKDETLVNIINESKGKKEKEKKNKITRLDSDFENLEKIGEGGYGLVLKGTHKIDKYIYAIKIINISDFKNIAQIDEIVNEANKMSMIKDKYIVNYNICWYEDNLGTAEKFYEKKDEDLLNSKTSSLSNQDDITIKSNNSTKLMKQKNNMSNFRSIYCTNYRDDSKLINNSILSMKYKKKFFIILMEYCDGHTLEDLIQNHKKNKTPIDRHLIYTYIRQILKGLKVLHRNGLIHSDIKPGNIFLKKVGETDQVKIGDFGMAMLKKKGGKLNSKDIKGYTPLYSAPEQMNAKGTYNEKIDIYACGLIFYELIGGFTTNAEKYRAFDDLKDFGTIFDEIEKKYKEESELIKLMTKKDYDERPSAEEILVSNVFKELGKIVNK